MTAYKKASRRLRRYIDMARNKWDLPDIVIEKMLEAGGKKAAKKTQERFGLRHKGKIL